MVETLRGTIEDGLLDALVQSSADIIAATDLDGRLLVWNRKAEEVFGYTTEQASALNILDVVPERFLEQHTTNRAAVLAGRPVFDIEMIRLARDGREVRTVGSISPIVRPSGEIVGTCVVCREVGDETQLKSVLHGLAFSKHGIVGEVLDGTIAVWNAGAEQLLGWTQAEMEGQSFLQMVEPRQQVAIGERLEGLRRSRGTIKITHVKLLAKDGTPVDAAITAWAVDDRLGNRLGVCLQIRDLSHEMRLRREVEGSQRLKAMGRLAGGVVHDFNNLLTVAGTYAELVRDRLRDAPHIGTNEVDAITQAVERGARLTRQLLAFASPRVQEPSITDFAAALEGVISLVQRTLGEDIDLHASIAPDLGHVRGDLAQLEQVILNLVINARDAMPNGGRLEISARNVDLDGAPEPELESLPPGRYVQLEVRDNGVGISEEHAQEVFEPFFTTKSGVQGVGLGLSTAYGIVRQYDGDIRVVSALGAGATFRVRLPYVEPREIPVIDPGPERATAPPTETIMVLDDDEGVRTVASRVLRNAGYTVIACAGPGQALLELERRVEIIDLLITDVVMPLMGGRELADRAAEIRPSLRVLYMSGFPASDVVRAGPIPAGVPYLDKPFARNTLLAKVRSTLGSSMDDRLRNRTLPIAD